MFPSIANFSVELTPSDVCSFQLYSVYLCFFMNFLKYFDIQQQQQTPKLYQFLLYTNRQKNNI